MRTAFVYMDAKMVGKKGNKKSKNQHSATQPTPVFSATAPASSAAGPSSSHGRNPALPPARAHPDHDEFSDPESSLFDYQQMDEAGYATVGFGTWPNQGRRPRESNQGMPRFPQTGTFSMYAEPGDVGMHGEGGDGDTAQLATGNISDLYATPMKKKGKGKGTSSRSMTESRGEDNGGMTMNKTQQDVRAAMEQVQEMPEAGQTMVKTVARGVHADSGIGSSRQDLHQDSCAHTNSPNNDLAQISETGSASNKRGQKAVKNAMDSLRVLPGEADNDKTSLLDNDVIESMLVASDTSRLHASQSSGRISARNRTPRAAADRGVSDMELYHLKMINEEMQGELHTLRKVAESIHDRDFESASTLYFRKEIEKMKDENETLRTTVHRLNVELSDYQAKYRPVEPELMKKAKELHGLPSKGPIPSWLISKRYLAPLFLAYDDHLEEKDVSISELKNELGSIKSRVEEIVKENQKLRMTGGAALGGLGDFNEWQQLQEQAKLVLEENQLLMEQLEVQNMKSKDLYTAHVAEISRLAKKLSLSEGEKADTEREMEDLRLRFRELKHKHDQSVMEAGSQVNVQSHINSIADLKRTVTQEKEQQEKLTENIGIKLKASEEERKRQGLEMIEITAENKKLRAEVKAMQRSVRQAQHRMTLLHKAVELSENKEMVTQEQLAQVIKVAEKTALERDTVYKVAKEQQQENHFNVNKMMNGSVAVGKLEEKLKLYRMKAQAKLSTVADRLKDQDETFNNQKKEYNREIHYLRLLVKEKEEIINTLEKSKKEVEEDLDTMWQAANCENQRIKTMLRSGSRKLKEHGHLSQALNEEIEYEEEMHFLESEGK